MGTCSLALADVPAQAAATAPATTTPTSKPAPLVYIERGTLPLIISAPHGGRLPIPGADVRTGGNFLIKKGKKNNFTMAFDANVDLVALQLADEIERRTGQRPYLVVANFSRRFVDANRTPEEAYESEPGRIVYEAYHNAIRTARAEIINEYKRGLLIDIHGHGGDPESIIRGTADWTSVRHLVEEFGKDALVGPKGLLTPIAAGGANKFNPPLDQLDALEVPSLNGGFITRQYGSYAGGNFDSIQFELGNRYRKRENIPPFVKQLADGIVPFVQTYIIDAPRTVGVLATTGPASTSQAAGPSDASPATKPAELLAP
jgi:hypothetical protein